MDLNIPLLKTVCDINDLETATSFKSKLSMSYEWTPLCGGVWDCVFDVCVRAYLVFGVFCVCFVCLVHGCISVCFVCLVHGCISVCLVLVCVWCVLCVCVLVLCVRVLVLCVWFVHVCVCVCGLMYAANVQVMDRFFTPYPNICVTIDKLIVQKLNASKNL